jgi:hypothetical protein
MPRAHRAEAAPRAPPKTRRRLETRCPEKKIIFLPDQAQRSPSSASSRFAASCRGSRETEPEHPQVAAICGACQDGARLERLPLLEEEGRERRCRARIARIQCVGRAKERFVHDPAPGERLGHGEHRLGVERVDGEVPAEEELAVPGLGTLVEIAEHARMGAEEEIERRIELERGELVGVERALACGQRHRALGEHLVGEQRRRVLDGQLRQLSRRAFPSPIS